MCTFGQGWAVYFYLDVIWNVFQGCYIVFGMLSIFRCLENKCLVWVDHTDPLTPSLPNPGIGIFALRTFWQSASPLYRDGVKTDLIPTTMINDMFPLTSAIILPKVLTLCYLIHLETLAGIDWIRAWHWNIKEKSIDISQLEHIMIIIFHQQTFVFHIQRL